MVMTLAGPALSSSPKSLPELDIELFTFVERYATNLVRMDLLMFFGGNPEERITAANLARVVRRTLRATKKELDDLTYLRILTRRYTPEKVTYQLTRRREARSAVMRLAAFVRERDSQEGI
jgi:hypothetical protein